MKGYRVNFPGHKKIEVSPSVVFDDDATFGRSKKDHANEDTEVSKPPQDSEPIAEERNELEDSIPGNHDELEPQRPADVPKDMITYKRRPSWEREVVMDAEKYGAPDGTSRE